MIRPESQIAPVELNVNEIRLHAATPGPNPPMATRNTAIMSRPCATMPPLTSVIGLTPQARACGHESRTGIEPIDGVPG